MVEFYSETAISIKSNSDHFSFNTWYLLVDFSTAYGHCFYV